MSTPLYPGIGNQLRRSDSPPTQLQPLTYTIPTTKSSEPVSMTPAMTGTFNVLFGTAPSGTAFNVMYDISNAMTNEYVLQAVPAVASQTLYTWSTSQFIDLSGFIRITNAGGQDITACYVQMMVGPSL